jgi:hypothetical protein
MVENVGSEGREVLATQKVARDPQLAKQGAPQALLRPAGAESAFKHEPR